MGKDSFKGGLIRVLKQIHPSLSIQRDGIEVMDSMMRHLFNIIIDEAVELIIQYTKKKTVTSREIQTIVRLVFPGELAKHGISESTKAVTKALFHNGRVPSLSRKYCGLSFVPSLSRKLFKMKYNQRFARGGIIYITAALEYISAEVIELAGNCCLDNKRRLITPGHIHKAISYDAELNTLFFINNSVLIHHGGTLPHIHSALLGHQDRKKDKQSKFPASQPQQKNIFKFFGNLNLDENNENKDESEEESKESVSDEDYEDC